jgi:membrane peptidoglycan carboxypeptidase
MTYTPDWVVGTWAGHTDSTHPGEIGLNKVFGTDEAKAIAVPFVNTLTKPSAFAPVKGAFSSGCDQTLPAGDQGSCPTATPSPSPSATPSATPATPTPVPTFEATPVPTPTPPLLSLPPFLGTPTANPTPTHTPTPSPGGGGQQQNKPP